MKLKKQDGKWLVKHERVTITFETSADAWAYIFSNSGKGDEVMTLRVTAGDFERLIRDSEKVATLKRLLEKHHFITTVELKTILGVEEAGEKNVQ